MDPSKMKVQELRSELQKRGAPTDGLKVALKDRLIGLLHASLVGSPARGPVQEEASPAAGSSTTCVVCQDSSKPCTAHKCPGCKKPCHVLCGREITKSEVSLNPHYNEFMVWCSACDAKMRSKAKSKAKAKDNYEQDDEEEEEDKNDDEQERDYNSEDLNNSYFVEHVRGDSSDDLDDEDDEDDEREVAFRLKDGTVIYKDDIAEVASSSSSSAQRVDIPEPQGRSLQLPVGPNTLGLPEDYVPWSKVIYLDAGFGSLQLAELLAQRHIHCVMGVKQIDKYFPKQALYDLMEHAEAGAKAALKLEAGGEFERGIIAVGYKYNQRKVLYFIMTSGAGSLQDGQPYLSKFTDEYGNTVIKEVRRPQVISQYFARANKIDAINGMRQHELALEDQWVTQDCWFRLFTTMAGMVATDCHLAVRSSVVEGHEWKSLTVKQFANILASQLVNNELSGCNSGMYSSGVVADETLGDESEDEHIPAMYDKKRVRRSPMRSGKGKGPKKNMYYQVQKTCSVCTKKTAYFCGHRHCGERFPICSQHLRADCLKAHRDDYKSRTGQSEIELFARQPAAKKYKTQRGRRRTTS